jgi:hypothetical protein
MINDEMGEAIAEEFADEADTLLAQYSEGSDLNEKKKNKKMNGDKVFKKDKEVKDNKIMQANPVKSNFESPGKRLSMRSNQSGAQQ